jgi:DNA-binding NarL/FixJ family response regulator
MQSLRSDGLARDPSAVGLRVSIVCRDDLAVPRIAKSLSSAGIGVLDRVSDVVGLADQTPAANAIVLAGGNTTDERRTLIMAVGQRFPGVPSVVIASASMNGVHKAIGAGASGVVLDTDIESALPATIRAICAGQVVVPHRFRRHAIRPALSHRERQTLALVATGMTNRQIATHLYLAESTVKTHMTSIFGKLGVGSRSEAAALVLDPDQRLKLGLHAVPQASPVAGQNGGLHS